MVGPVRAGTSKILSIDDSTTTTISTINNQPQEPGAIVGVIGANGCGKTTLFNVLSGKVPPDAGTVELGPTVKLGLVSQLRDELDDNKTVYQEIAQSEDFITVIS